MNLEINISEFINKDNPRDCIFDNVDGVVNFKKIKELNINKLTIIGNCKLKVSTEKWSIINIEELTLINVVNNNEINEFLSNLSSIENVSVAGYDCSILFNNSFLPQYQKCNNWLKNKKINSLNLLDLELINMNWKGFFQYLVIDDLILPKSLLFIDKFCFSYANIHTINGMKTNLLKIRENAFLNSNVYELLLSSNSEVQVDDDNLSIRE